MAIAAAVPSFVSHAERQPYDRYQSIVDRQMFGMPPPGFDPTKPPSEVSAKEERAAEKELSKEQEQVRSAVHFSVINVTPSGETAVGFTDNSDSKNPKHYYLKVGESRDGWTVKEADPLEASMTIAKGEVEVSLKIGGNSANGGTKRAGAGAGQAAAGRPNLLGARSGGRSMGSLRERRNLRAQQQAEAAKAAAEERARLAEEREKERAQREAEREAEKAEREKEREETQKKLAEMAEEIKRQREASAEKKESDGGGENNKEEDGEQ